MEEDLGDVLVNWAFRELGTREFTVMAAPDESWPETVRNHDKFRNLLLAAVNMGRNMAAGRPTIIDLDAAEAHELMAARLNSGDA
ncbi:hypothetical protein [Herbaspirillum sp. NPDC101396]|uniref:hypothetical protein n=1 Tax=Herbaspirillum sp. NPDC101396 TaxID=3364005 RepID=UPI00383B21FC